jgi:hypothetical protein
MSKADVDREKRLADALRQNLRRRKAQARGEMILPGTGRGTAGTALEGARCGSQDPLQQAPPGPPPRPGED